MVADINTQLPSIKKKKIPTALQKPINVLRKIIA